MNKPQPKAVITAPCRSDIKSFELGKAEERKSNQAAGKESQGSPLLGQSLFWAKTNAGGSDWAAVHLLFSFSLFAFRRTEQKQNRNNQLNLAPAESPVADKLSH